MASRHEHDALLAAFLEATHKIDLRALRKQAPGEMPQPVNIEVQAEPVTTAMLEAEPPKPADPFAFRRANLVAGS
jgi:hypothetical protein